MKLSNWNFCVPTVNGVQSNVTVLSKKFIFVIWSVVVIIGVILGALFIIGLLNSAFIVIFWFTVTVLGFIDISTVVSNTLMLFDIIEPVLAFVTESNWNL